jgi:hypothetical protein
LAAFKARQEALRVQEEELKREAEALGVAYE